VISATEKKLGTSGLGFAVALGLKRNTAKSLYIVEGSNKYRSKGGADEAVYTNKAQLENAQGRPPA
jgi:hypothetical protein